MARFPEGGMTAWSSGWILYLACGQRSSDIGYEWIYVADEEKFIRITWSSRATSYLCGVLLTQDSVFTHLWASGKTVIFRLLSLSVQRRNPCKTVNIKLQFYQDLK